MSIENERRFLVHAIHKDLQYAPRQEIEQGYLVASIDHILRIRLVDDRYGFAQTKDGQGQKRNEGEPHHLPTHTAEMFLRNCRYRLTKTRYSKDGWEIDFFHGPLEGLVVAEFEFKDADETLVFPPWLKEVDVVEVTNVFGNYTLAKLAYEISLDKPTESLPEILLKKDVPSIVITGGPCSGKSSVLRHLKETWSDRVHCVPEAASIIIRDVGAKPVADALGRRTFNRELSRVQRSFERLAALQAGRDGKQLILLDRGVSDNMAYLPGGWPELEHVYGTTRASEYAEHLAVICLDIPPREIYEAMKANNPARIETYGEARDLDRLIKVAWCGHRNFRNVRSTDTWEEKIALVTREIDSLCPQ